MGAIGPVPVLNAGWLQIGLSLFTMHDQALPPVPPVKAIPGLIEGPAFMGWPPGLLSHKKADSVITDGNPTVQHGHDIGYLIPHFQIPMNALSAIHTLLSKHKVVFPVQSVTVEGKPIGTYLFFLLSEICSNPVSLPTGVVVLLKATVWTSMSIFDLLIGLLVLGLDVLLDAIWGKVKDKLPKVPGPKNLNVLNGLSLSQIMTPAHLPILGSYLLREGTNKVVQHLAKTWVLSPLLTGLPFGKSGIGRGNWAYYPFLGGTPGSMKSDADH